MASNDPNPPHVPDLKSDFNRASQPVQEEAQRDQEDTQRGMVTAAELKRLEDEREQHTLEPHLTIDGTVEQEVHTRIAEEREARINYIKERLEGASKRLSTDFRESANKKSPDPPTLTDIFNRASSRNRS